MANLENRREKTRNMTLTVREFEAGANGETPKKEVRVSVSSEAPVVETVYDGDRGEWVRAYEVLGHGEGEIDFSRMDGGLVIQDTHHGDQIGLIRNVEVKDGKLGGVIEWCCGDRAQEIRKDAECGLRRNMSVGYMVNEWRKCGESDDGRGLPIYRAVSWTPYEASFVNVPADTRVGVDREADMTKTETAAQTAAITERKSEMDKPENTPAVENAAVDNSAEIRALKDEVVALRESIQKPEMPAAERAKPQFDEPETKEIAREYDLMKVIRSLAGIRGTDAGFEREISDEIAKQTKREARGYFIPDCVLNGRAFDKGTNAGNLVATDTLFSEMVPALVAKTVLGQAGVRTISGLVGDVEIPVAGSASAYWVTTEGGDATESTPTIGQIKASPKTIGAYTDITRKLMNQAGISPQAFVADALRSALARGIELAAFSGAGTSGAPKGIDGFASGDTTLNVIASATNPGLAKVLEFITAIEAANADPMGGKFIGRPSVWSLLGSTIDYTQIEASGTAVGGVTSGKYLLDTKSNICQGYEFIKSNLATDKILYFGDWSKMVLAFWSGLDLTVDTSSLSKSGGVRLVALQDMDVVVTQPKAFSRGQVIA